MEILQMELPMARKSDPHTSHEAGGKVQVRAGSHRAMVLNEYWKAPEGLIDEQAGERSGLLALRSCYWKRCSELRTMGLIVDTGETRASSLGNEQMVCKITLEGIRVMVELER